MRGREPAGEVHLAEHGWVAMDPADVGKVMRLETPEWLKTTKHPVVAPVNKALFGGWEGNWMAFNVAHDVALPGSRGPCHNLNVSSTMSLSRALDAREQHYSIALAQAVISESKLELLCEDEHTDAVVELIAEEAKTGQDDAGWIYAATLTHVQHVSGRRTLTVKSPSDPLQPD